MKVFVSGVAYERKIFSTLDSKSRVVGHLKEGDVFLVIGTYSDVINDRCVFIVSPDGTGWIMYRSTVDVELDV